MNSKHRYLLLILLIFSLIITGIFVNKKFKSKNEIELLINSCSTKWNNLSKIDKNIAGVNALMDLPQDAKWCAVDLNPEINNLNSSNYGDKIKLNLCPDINYLAIIDDVSQNVNNTKTIRGRIANQLNAYIIITTTQDKSLVEIEIPKEEKQFTIKDNDSSSGFLIESSLLSKNKLEDAPTLDPPEESEEEPVNNTEDGEETIDVLIVYTPQAKSWADTYSSGIDNVIAQAMTRGDLVNDNSNSEINFRLVHSAQINYTESGNSSTDLSRLTNQSDGYMDEVGTLRDTYSADLVTLLAQVNDTGGISWLLNDPDGLPNYAFSLVRVQQAGNTYTLVHELGHNLGLHHSKLQNFQPGPGLFSYSAGWRWVGEDTGKYCSVMTYESGSYFADGQTHVRVPYWSNPSINYQSVATGDAVDGDNARTVREIKSIISGYRTAIPTINISSPSAAYTINGPVSYTITYGDASDVTLSEDDVTLNKTGTANGTIAVSGSGTETRTITISDITGIGTLGISLAAATATNTDGNPAAAAGPSTTFVAGSLSAIISLSSTYFSTGWNMSSFPDLSSNVMSNTLLPATYKIRKYDGATNTYIKGEDSDIRLTAGAGYWLRADNVNLISGRAYPMNQVSSTEIPVTYGWNLLGNPYQSAIPLSNLRVKYINGTTESFEDAIGNSRVAGYVWSWEKSSNQYIFIAIHPDRYRTDAIKQTTINPYRGFWLLTRFRDISSIIINR